MRPPLSAGGRTAPAAGAALGTNDDREDDVADRVEGAEPDPSCEDERERLPGVRPEAVPVPEVHGAAEREAEREAEGGERPPGSGSDRRRERRRRLNRPRQASATVSRRAILLLYWFITYLVTYC